MPKIVVRTPFPTPDEVARTLGLSADEQAEVLERVEVKHGRDVVGSRLRADDARTKKGRSATLRTKRRSVAAKRGRVRRAK